jgi:hypothetical protein
MGRAPQISRAAVLAAALGLADEQGLEAVTMHAVAGLGQAAFAQRGPYRVADRSGRREVARAERLISTAVLGFAASEAAGRFRQHDRSIIDADFAELLRWLRLPLAVP